MPVPLVRDEAMLFNHFTRHLGRWLDCTNAARIFTLTISEKIHESPILFNAVLCFAARHRRDTIAGDRHYERCISLLIEGLGSTQAYDELLLSAVLLLHFADQLGGDDDRANTQSRDKHHLKGTSSILRASLKEGFVDPSASSLRDAAFWIYVRQSLYNATISQEPLDLDLTLTLHPTPDHMTDSHPLAWLRIETAWANQVLWITARVANFCFSGSKVPATWRDVGRLQQWHDLWDANEKWRRERPSGFDAIGEGECADDHVFPDVWFTADWHGELCPKAGVLNPQSQSDFCGECGSGFCQLRCGMTSLLTSTSHFVRLLSLLCHPPSTLQTRLQIPRPVGVKLLLDLDRCTYLSLRLSPLPLTFIPPRVTYHPLSSITTLTDIDVPSAKSSTMPAPSSLRSNRRCKTPSYSLSYATRYSSGAR